MPKEAVIGNGNFVVCLDKHGYVRDLYFPYVGQENHVQGHRHKIGIFVDNQFSWLDSNEWEISIDYRKDTLIAVIKAVNKFLDIELVMEDFVDHHINAYIKKITLKNLQHKKRNVKLFFNQHFHISEANIGDTSFYQPEEKAIIAYKGRRYFLMSCMSDSLGIQDYAIGSADVDNMQGTYVDAEDGILSQNPVEHGSVDSTFAMPFLLEANSSQEGYYWITAARKFREAADLHHLIIKKSPAFFMENTAQYWRKWLRRSKHDLSILDERMADLFKKSLLIIKTQTDNRGAIIASTDSDTLQFKRDTYAYMWPRDGALIARSLDRAGYRDMSEAFFRFCAEAITDGGYLLHKYRPDGSLGSSWHSWVKGRELQLPIQEDQTALVLDALWKHYKQYKNKDFVKNLYYRLIKKGGHFMSKFIEPSTGLPDECYDLWEEKFGIHTFTCATVYAGLMAASGFAHEFGDKEYGVKFHYQAERIRKAILEHLYDPTSGMFIKGLHRDEHGKLVKDMTVDISNTYGIFEFGILDARDERVRKSMEKTLSILHCANCKPEGGIARYQGDNYHKKTNDVAGNPWILSTMWVAEYYISLARTAKELRSAEELFGWVERIVHPSGIMAEQYNPLTGDMLSVAPLTWSHASYIIAVTKYIEKLRSF